VWRHGLTHEEFERYATQFFKLAVKEPAWALLPEALLQHVDDGWLTEVPSALEASSYQVNSRYVGHLLEQMGRGNGEALEVLAQYLMSCIPGCRTRRHLRSRSSDYDVVCMMEGLDFDFRSELGRIFVCECKDWAQPLTSPPWRSSVGCSIR